MGYLGNQLFPVMMENLRANGTFWTLASGALLSIICVYLFVPETKGFSLEEITFFWTSRRAPKNYSLK
jgi:hypothetical protein